MKKLASLFTYIELFLAVISFVIILNFSEYEENLGLVLSDYLRYIPLALNLAVFVMLIIEFRLDRRIFIGRLILASMFILMLIFLSINKKIDLFNTILMIIDLIYCVLAIITIIKFSNKHNKKIVELPEGYFSKKSLCIFNFELVCCIILYALVLFLAIYYKKYFIIPIGLLFCLIIIWLFSIFSIYKDNRFIHDFYKNLDYDSFINKLTLIYSEKLNSDTRSTLKCNEYNALCLIDKERANELFINIKVPDSKLNLDIYNNTKLLYLALNGFYEEFDLFIKELKINKNVSYLISLKNALTLCASEEELDLYFNLKTKKKYDYYFNCYVRYLYFKGLKNDLYLEYELLLKQENNKLLETKKDL